MKNWLVQRLAKSLEWKLAADSRVEKTCQRFRSRFAIYIPIFLLTAVKKKKQFGMFLFLFLIQTAHAGITVLLDLDDTVLKEVPVQKKGNPRVQVLHYKPGPEFYQIYQARLKSQNNNSGKVIHYELDANTEELTAYVIVRPGIRKLLDILTMDHTNQILVVSNNDPARTKAIVEKLKIGGKTLAEMGARQVPNDIFQKGLKKSFSAIRKWAKLKDNEQVYAVDDHPEYYTEPTSLDHPIGIEPWNYQNGVSQLLSDEESNLEVIKAQFTIIQHILNQLPLAQWSTIFAGSKTSLSQSAPSALNHTFKIIPKPVDLSDSPIESKTDEYYTERPDIDTVTPQDHSTTLSPLWSSLRMGHLEAIAEILEFYPEHHLYFLARDAEFLYDFSRVILANEPEQLERIHLLNISRANMEDRNLLKYLAQEGISKENLKNGMKVMFVDTGLVGTIPTIIANNFPVEVQENLQTHLMCSSSPSFPSSRVFLEHFHPGASEINPSTLHRSIAEYEHIPRYTFRAQTFKVIAEKWTPTAVSKKDRDGKINRPEAQKYMEDLKGFALTDACRKKWSSQRRLWKEMRQLLDSGQKEKLKKMLEELLNSNHPIRKAMVRDLVEIVQRNEPSKMKDVPTLESIGLAKIKLLHGESNKMELLHSHPEWKKILDNPDAEIPKLVNGNDLEIQTLRNIIDEIWDEKTQKIIAISVIFKADDFHKKTAAETFETIFNQKKWRNTIHDIFENYAHTNYRILEIGLKTAHQGQPISKDFRSLVARILAKLSQIKNIHILFAKALVDDAEEVRQDAAQSLLLRNPSDAVTLQMLVKLLGHSDVKIRNEIAALIYALYPIVQEKGAFRLLRNYLRSDYLLPITDLVWPNVLEDTLKTIQNELIQNDGDKPHPFVLISKTDPRVSSQAFASLGKMVQVMGLIWSGVAQEKMTHARAENYCLSLGARLPKIEDLGKLYRAKQLGLGKLSLPFEEIEQNYWSGSSVSQSQNYYSFTSKLDQGTFNRDIALFVICVSDPAQSMRVKSKL